MKNYKLIYLLLLVFISQITFAADSATENYQVTIYDKTLSSSSRVVISQKEILASAQNTLTQLVAQKAGLNIINGALNAQSYYLRGGDSSHILILVDEMPVYDALSATRSFQLDTINKASVQKIEVVKGSQTAIYGGQALVAVIKVTTINSNLDKSKGLLKLNAGNYSLLQADVDYQILNENTTYQISASAGSKEMRSSLVNSSQIYPQKKKSYDIAVLNNNEYGQILIKARHFDDNRSIVNRTNDAIDNIAKNNYDLLGVKFEPSQIYLPRIFYSLVKSERIYTHPINSLNTLEIDQKYYGNLQTLNIEKNLKLESFEILIGHQQTFEKGEIKNIKGQNPTLNGIIVNPDSRQLGTYFSVKKELDAQTDVSAGYRYNDFNGNQQNQQLQLGYKVGLLKFEYSEGFKTPTLFNLYDVNYGNLNLKSEKAQSATIDYQVVNEKSTYDISLFYTNFTDLITVTKNSLSVFQYLNINSAEISGLDLGYNYEFENSNLGFNVTYQQPKDKLTGDWLDRRPFFIGSAYYNLKCTDQLSLGADMAMNSSRLDKVQTGVRSLSEFWIYNTSIAYGINPLNSINLKINNIFDKRYEESADYLAEGRLVNLEFEAKF